jgi:hypothetical protein
MVGIVRQGYGRKSQNVPALQVAADRHGLPVLTLRQFTPARDP